MQIVFNEKELKELVFAKIENDLDLSRNSVTLWLGIGDGGAFEVRLTVKDD